MFLQKPLYIGCERDAKRILFYLEYALTAFHYFIIELIFQPNYYLKSLKTTSFSISLTVG